MLFFAMGYVHITNSKQRKHRSTTRSGSSPWTTAKPRTSPSSSTLEALPGSTTTLLKRRQEHSPGSRLLLDIAERAQLLQGLFVKNCVAFGGRSELLRRSQVASERRTERARDDIVALE